MWSMFSFVYVALIWLLFISQCNGDNLPKYQVAALEDLYNSTSGAEWYWLPADQYGPRWFNGSSNPCDPEWQGLRCRCLPDGSCTITDIALPDRNMTGTIPWSIENLTDLTYLDIGNNSLWGTIPPTMGRLGALNTVYMNINNLSGSIPDEFYNASSINSLWLSSNSLSGTLSPLISKMDRIVNLYLFENNMTGSLPSSIGELVYLRTLEVSVNRFNGTIDVFLNSDMSLETISAFDNDFSGTISSALCIVVSLNVLEVSFNRLSGSIPDCLNRLDNLETVYLNNNQLNGSIPESLFNCSKLTTLYLGNNFLTGVIPDNIGNMLSLEVFGLYYTNITGTIPSSIGDLQDLHYLYVNNNQLYGLIPESLYDCPLIELIADYNRLSGSISNSIGNWTILMYFIVSFNEFTGTLPEAVCIPSLTNFNVLDNHINGTLPHCLFQLESLQLLYLYHNNFTGTLPSQMFLPSVTTLCVNDNELSGTIPASLGAQSQLQYLYLDENNFNGSVPEDIFSLTLLVVLEIYRNYLTGTLSNAIGNLTQLSFFYCYDNYLVGTLPEALCNANRTLSQLGINSNYFSGPFPDCIWSMPNIVVLSISSNQFTGTLKANLSGWSDLTELLLYSNHFTGPLPVAVPESVMFVGLETNEFTGPIPPTFLSPMKNCEILYLHYNFLTGTIPSSLSSLLLVNSLNFQNNLLSGSLPPLSMMDLLNFVFVSNNILSGSVSVVFDSTVQIAITNIGLSSNQFTGTLPVDVFNIPGLSSFAAVSNCFTGTLSADMCKATQLTALALDGLHTASSCRSSLLPLVSASYGLNYYWSGGIPECLFNMSQITTLHVSGNGIGGSLPANLTLGPYLTDLALSYNQLTGHIPESIGNRAFDNVDLSFNRFGGVLSASPYQGKNTTVSYQVNRLSGNIPAVLRDVDSISILNGNHFLCQFDRHQLPKHDKQYSYYECGTSSLEKSMYVWVALFVVACVVSVYLWYNASSDALSYVHQTAQVVVDSVSSWLNIFSSHESNPVNVQLLGVFMRDLRRCTALLTMFVVLVLIPTNVALSQYYDTYQYPYAWSVASVYLSGYTAAVVLSVLFALLLLWMVLVMYSSLTSVKENLAKAELVEGYTDIKQSFKLRMVFSLVLITLFNFAVVLSVNIGYVLVATRYNPTIVSMTQIAVSVYKLVWNDLIVRNLVAWFHRYWSVKCSLKHGVSVIEDSEWSGSYLTFNIYTLIFNVIMIPCLATAAVSSDCFYDVLVPSSDVKSSYNYNLCSSIVEAECVLYTYQTETTSYLPPYMYRYQCSSTLVTTYAILYVYNFIILSFFQPLLVVTLMWWRRQLDEEGVVYRVLVSVGVFVTDIGRLFDKDRFNLRMIMYLSIFVTFGVIFPPLAVMILLTVVVQTYFTQLLLGHFVNSIESESTRQSSLQVLDVSCKSASVLFKQTVYVVCPCAAFFYAYTVYDTCADAGGGSGAVWMSCSLFAAGCVAALVLKLAVDRELRRRTSRCEESEGVVRSSVIEIGSLKSKDYYLDSRNPIHRL